MPKTAKKSRTLKKNEQETDSVYLLKLVLYMVLGAQWVRITKGTMEVPVPVGFIIGILFARHDHFKIDRKIEYALLLASTFIAFWLPIGLEIIIR
jgi:hypothetical protein